MIWSGLFFSISEMDQDILIIIWYMTTYLSNPTMDLNRFIFIGLVSSSNDISTLCRFIIIMSRHQHGYPWPFLATLLDCPLLLAALQGYILYRHRASVCMFQLVILPLLVHVKESTGVHHLWVLTNFSSSVPHVWFV